VRSIPNFAVFYRGQLVKQQAGLVDHEQMEGWLESATQASVV
jgi:thioredoxin 2